MAEKLEEIDKEILDLFVKVSLDFGNDGVLARLMSMIYLSPDEVSLEELMEKTGYSAATISNKTRILINHGFVKKVSKPGTKKAYYYMEKDIKKAFCSSIGKIIDVKIKPIKENLPGLIERYKKSMDKTDKDAKRRLEILENHLKSVEILEEGFKGFITKIKSY